MLKSELSEPLLNKLNEIIVSSNHFYWTLEALNYYANQLNIAIIWGQYQPLMDL